MKNVTIGDILATASIYANNATTLKEIINQMESDLEAVRAKYIPQITQLAKVTSESKNLALALIKDNPQFFSKPRSIKFNEVEMGYRKTSDSVEIIDQNLTIELINRLMPERYPVIVKQSLTLVKDSLKNLSQKERELIKVFMVEGENTPYVKLINKELNKTVEAAINTVV